VTWVLDGYVLEQQSNNNKTIRKEGSGGFPFVFIALASRRG
jgi:hypothetical protein